jgi:hypothetical protein
MHALVPFFFPVGEERGPLANYGTISGVAAPRRLGYPRPLASWREGGLRRWTDPGETRQARPLAAHSDWPDLEPSPQCFPTTSAVTKPKFKSKLDLGRLRRDMAVHAEPDP